MLLQKRISLFSIAVMAFLFNASAQHDIRLSGVVVEQNSKIRTGHIIYLQGVSIKAPQATPQMSDAYGKFNLIFSDVPVGNVTHINVTKYGYKVVNLKVLEAAAVMGRKEPLQIVMCKEDLLYENQLLYYSLATKVNKEVYEKQIKILEQGGKNKDQLISHLQKEFNREIKSKEEAYNILKQQYQIQNNEMDLLAGQLGMVNLDDESEIYREAFQLFQAKNIEKAISLLDSVHLEERLAANSKELQKKQPAESVARRMNQMRQDVSQCMFKARLHMLKFDLRTARQTYLLALKYDSTDISNLWEIGSFLLNHNDESLAKKCFDKILFLQQNNLDKAGTLSDLGKSYKNIANYEESEKYYAQAVKLLKPLYEKDTGAYRTVLAGVLKDVGLLYSELEYYTTAEKHFLESDEIFGSKYHTIESPFIPDEERLIWSDALHNLCLYFLKEGNYYGAFRYYNFQAIPLLTNFKGQKDDRYNIQLARELFNCGISEFYLKDYERAAEQINKGLDLAKALAKNHPDKYAGDLASMLNGLGRLCYELHAFNEAEKFCMNGLKIFRDISDKNSSDLYLSNLSATLNNLGLLQDGLKNFPKAEEYFTEALHITRQLVIKKPAAYSSGLAATLHNLGLLYDHWKKYPQAEQFYKESIIRYEALEEKNFDVYSNDLAEVLHNLGRLYHQLKDNKNAEKYYNRALKIQLHIIKKRKQYTNNENDLPFYLSGLSATVRDLDRLYDHWRSDLASDNFLADAKKEYNAFYEKNKPYPYQVAETTMNLGKFYYKLEIYLEAEKILNRVLNEYRELYKNNLADNSLMRDYRTRVTETSIYLLRVYQKQLEATEDFSLRNKALKLLKETPGVGPDEYRQDLSYQLKHLDSVFKNVTSKDLHINAFLKPFDDLEASISNEKDPLIQVARQEEMIKELELKLKEYPGVVPLTKRLSIAYGNLSYYYVFVKQFQKAVTASQKGLALDPTEAWINGNLALGYLLQGNWVEAKKIYEKFKDELNDDFLKDLQTLREAGIIHPRMRDAEELLLR